MIDLHDRIILAQMYGWFLQAKMIQIDILWDLIDSFSTKKVEYMFPMRVNLRKWFTRETLNSELSTHLRTNKMY